MSVPARLLSVRLQGFKSFADRTHVEFGPGISAIVGPNGSGKSNLADALRWALGEQGRALRTRKSEDVVWAGSERRPAVGMADVQITLDNGDGLLPVEYGVVELGRRLYRSGENDYLLNRQRVRLKDLVDLLDAGHLAENAFLFIGQGMVDQALALRPEERRPLFEEVAGVRRHERRRRRAEEQLVESEANLARVDDILAELRPQAKRLAQQAEQQANRRSAADDLAEAILASAHARWHGAGSRAVATAAAVATARALVDAAMAELLEHEAAITAANAALDGRALAETAARTTLDRVRADRAALQLREGRHVSELEAAGRERRSLEESRAVSAADVVAARQVLALPLAEPPTELEAELAALDAQIAAAAAGASMDGVASPADAAAIRRLEAAHAQEVAAARRRATDAERAAADELARATAASQRAAEAAAERMTAEAGRTAAAGEEHSSRTAREASQAAVAAAESGARAASDRLAGARAAAAAAGARYDEAKRALDAADGAAFSKAARARGGRSIADGLIIEAGLQQAVDAALAGLGRAHVLPRAEIGAIAADRGVAIAAESISTPDADVAAEVRRRITDAARARGGGPLAEAVRRDDSGAVTRLLARVVWLPNAAACLELQASLPAGWHAVSRDGTLVVGDVAAWLKPDGRGLHLQADVDRLATERTRVSTEAAAAEAAHAAADAALAEARTSLASARDAEAAAGAARRRADEAERAAVARADAAAREAAWLDAQAARLQAEATRLRAAAPAELPEPVNPAPASQPTALPVEPARERLAALRRQREALAAEVATTRAARVESERRRAQAEAAVALAERQLAYAAKTAGDLAEREARLATEREDLVALLADADRAVVEAEAALATIVAAATSERERLRAAESAATGLRERVRIVQEGSRIAERDELEARLALESLREGLLVELAGLGATGLRRLAGIGDETPVSSDDDLEPAALEEALTVAAAAWERTEPAADAPSPARLATLRRRFHDLGAVNPFAADEYAEVRTRLDGLEAQRSDIQAAIEHIRALIGELDTLVSEQFRRTFAALERAFDERFQQLFGGGFARLSLTDPQDLAATGIEITARPPGKKPQALAMLSGGERSLTAVALLFAMLEVRPVPFCVLDEVDAALDEANIGRFTDALKDLSRVTQCIVITHNRGTIEVADAMYGVTVGEDSVSRVISLRLDEATALADRSKRARPEAIPVGLDAGPE
ncbi:MAG: chromosome segregation protein SMC [Chloroflexi bacterium]|nr:chromosome segregation protein SMC [Chloroflexota bacterium]